ncbi:uncharacterized protein BDZ83DRAFT_597004 [Colletotrichum acutatum]|uniref:Uncharacterized protein n=1 Tax=Glomerella acutata TaxID=27357 RepID=A0AAD8XR86_GLOAC|nr:uncharacterized protein BDZ83DRAFT_597004 [Colletotrichum acutatum]KAK1731862.1 hypothetical protein BDZ83DRAFT_597004 [Colletotrichum acutatum]
MRLRSKIKNLRLKVRQLSIYFNTTVSSLAIYMPPALITSIQWDSDIVVCLMGIVLHAVLRASPYFRGRTNKHLARYRQLTFDFHSNATRLKP